MPTFPARTLVATLLACACPSASAADFWIIFGRGDAPARELFYASSPQTTTAQDDAPRSAQVVQVLEAPGLPAAIAYELQVQCRSQRMQVLSASARLPSGTETDLGIASGWTPATADWSQRALRFTCQPQHREADGMRELGDTPAQHLVLFTNRDLWGSRGKADASGQQAAIVRAGAEAIRRDLAISSQ